MAIDPVCKMTVSEDKTIIYLPAANSPMNSLARSVSGLTRDSEHNFDV